MPWMRATPTVPNITRVGMEIESVRVIAELGRGQQRKLRWAALQTSVNFSKR